MIKGIVFDLDSTLVQSRIDFPKMKRKIIKLLEEYGHPKDTLSPINQTTVQIREAAEAEWEIQDKPEELREELRRKITVYMDEGEMESIFNLSEIPGAKDAVTKLKAMGYKLAILTRSHHAYAIEALTKTGMLDSFDLVLGRGETPRPKPYKEALDFTVSEMDLKVNEIIFIGDHQIDWDSAKSSGCTFIGVTTGRRGLKSWENEVPPNILLESVIDLPQHMKDNC